MDASLIDRIIETVSGMDYRPSKSEADFQCQVEGRLMQAGFQFERQVRISDRDRFDIVVDGGIVLELKINGPVSPLASQLERYAQHESTVAIIVVTTRACHKQIECLGNIHGKPVRVVHVGCL